MLVETLSTFPSMYDSVMGSSMMRIAQEKGILTFKAHDLRDWTHDRHRTTDDEPYGGGAGLVMKCEPIFEAYRDLVSPAAVEACEDSATRRFAAQDPSDPSCAALLQSDDDLDGVQTVAPSSPADADARARYRIEIVKNTATPESTAQDTSVLLLDAAPVFKALLDDRAAGVPVGVIARRFHDAFVQAIADVAELCRALYGIGTVALSGGVFMNRHLIEHALEALERAGFTVAVNRELPPNDGCVSYGQAVVAWAANDEKA